LIREAEDQLPPTKRLLEKAESAGVTVSEADTRHSLKAKIEETGRLEEVVRLRKLGAEVAEDTSWEELSEWEDRLEIEEELKRKGLTFPPGTSLGELEDARYALEDLKEAAAHARQAGSRYRIEKGISVRDAQAHAAALSVVGDVYESLHYYYDGGAGSPKKTELKEALELLFERLKSGIVAEDDAYEWIEGRIGLERTGAAAGCLSLAAVLLPLSLALVGLFGVLG
jgi:sugar phosphate isomerase/epimerase